MPGDGRFHDEEAIAALCRAARMPPAESVGCGPRSYAELVSDMLDMGAYRDVNWLRIRKRQKRRHLRCDEDGVG